MGDTPIEIQWKVNGQRLHEGNDPRYVLREQTLDEGVVSELGISKTYRRDTGVFTCYASNAFGQDEMKIQLIVQEVPEVPKNIRVSEQQSRSLQVSWTQPYTGNSPIMNYIIEFKFVSDDWKKDPDKVLVAGTKNSAIIMDLQPSSSYNMRIIAENRLGKSEPSEVMEVTTLEEAPSGPPQEVFAEAETSTTIKVTWKPPLRKMWNGKLLGYYVGYQEHPTGYTPSNFSFSSNNFNFKTVETDVQYGGETVIQQLNKFFTYSIVVKAFNAKGSGPASDPVIVKTKEDVPSSAPDVIRCNTVSSQSIEVAWEPPNSEVQHGILLGYKVSYQPADNWYGDEELETKVTTLTKTIISGLLKYANYSVTLLAFTSAGDGVKSSPIFCKTDEDVPSSPKDIKAAVSSPSKIIVAWLPPRHKNGQLICYTIYMSLIEDGKEEGTHKKILGPENGFHEMVRHQDMATYQFWVTASTRIGEGESSRVVTIPPSNRVPARIISFSRNIVTPWKQTLNLTCKKVGLPAPQSLWKFKEKAMEKSNGRRQLHKDGSLIIKDVQKIDQGNYSCSVENAHGKDEITYNLIVEVPPERPKLSIISSTSDSLQLEWTVDNSNNENNILGYVINYKRDHGDWEELQIGAKITSYSLQNLWCATRYQLYVTAFNKIGMGLPCDIVNGYTMGSGKDYRRQVSVPAKPKSATVVTANVTSASVWVDTWLDGGCPITYFVIEYRTYELSSWALASNSVQPGDRVFVLSDLRANTKYNVRVTAHNNAGSSIAVYNFTTLMPIGGAIITPEENETSFPEDVPFYYNLKIIVVVFVMSTIATTLIALIAFIRRKRLMESHRSTLDDPPSLTRIPNEQNRDHYYLAMQIQTKAADVKDISDKDYMNDVCPYAAFKISKPPYSESSYSGNIYSGAYSSVKDSFPFRELNSDSYKIKLYSDSEYKKVRRKSGKLTEPHPESQESDNLGSTDSEVKKILSMHLPISEYDVLGSDSEAEFRLCTEHRDTDMPSFRYTPRSGKRIARMKSTGDDSSTSSEVSEVEFKFPSRKSKSKTQSVKRHIRSSSGYSSHAEETSFSSHPTMKISNHHGRHPTFEPSAECDKSRGKRRSSSRASFPGKFNRDSSFQIDV
ncbi:hypothetical protein RUM43_014659 [Polyplax serrata]|uniref:Down syndrome cell adhesion molecule-like protein Dscam2 n=1 Tax=Polyplax serrata TaxID=468196 RepID=A0AAN8S3K4_POLSC